MADPPRMHPYSSWKSNALDGIIGENGCLASHDKLRVRSHVLHHMGFYLFNPSYVLLFPFCCRNRAERLQYFRLRKANRQQGGAGEDVSLVLPPRRHP